MKKPHRKILHLHKDFSLAYRQRQSGSGSTIVFIHGFGSAKDHFRYAFDSRSLEAFTLITVDLVGFGQSRGPAEFGYSMREHAEVVIDFLNELGVRNFHLCAHSMGGLVAMNIAEMLPQRVLSFIDLEGNLTPEDCFVSGLVARGTLQEFAGQGRHNFEKDIRNTGAGDPTMLEYADMLAMASTTALYKSACHTVEDSSGSLVERLSRIRNTGYIYGEKNRGVFPSENLLRASGVPIFYIEGAGHSMATENPGQLYSVIKAFIDALSPIETS